MECLRREVRDEEGWYQCGRRVPGELCRISGKRRPVSSENFKNGQKFMKTYDDLGS